MQSSATNSGLSEFIRNASPEERKEVFDKVMAALVEKGRKAWAGVDINEFLTEQRGEYE